MYQLTYILYKNSVFKNRIGKNVSKQLHQCFLYLQKQYWSLQSPLLHTILINDVTQDFQKLREFTRTSPYVRHLGHYKCITFKDCNKNDRTLTKYNLEILQIYIILMNATLVPDIPLKQWVTSIVIIIPKKGITLKFNRLRVINEYEGDHSLILKYF